VLTRLLQRDPSLDGVAAVIFDEFHERSLQADLGLALCLHARDVLRPDLRIVVMSATLAGDDVATLLGGATRLRAQGRVHPVETHWLEGPLQARVEDAVARTVRHALEHDAGDILAFLPGIAEIRRTADRLTGADPHAADSRVDNLRAARALDGGVDVVPLYGDLPREMQQRAIEPSRPGRRKVVLATSIAETSLTIDGVRVVVDGGLMRVPRFAPRTGMTRLETVRVTRDAAEQRRGRAGRTAPGVCYRLWPAADETALRARRLPEIVEADLASLALELAAWGVVDPAELKWLDPPPEAALAQASELLERLDAIDSDGRITEHGRMLAELPTHPRLAHMLLRARALGLFELACDLAALLEERDVIRRHDGAPDCDVQFRLDIVRRARDHGYAAAVGPQAAHVDRNALARVLAEAREWRRRGGRGAEPTTPSSRQAHDAGRLLAFAYPDRIARRRGRTRGRFLLRTGAGARMPADHALADSEYIVAAQLSGHARDSTVWLAAAIDPAVLAADFAADIETKQQTVWDARMGAVRAVERRQLGAIIVAQRPLAKPDPEAVVTALIEGIRAAGESVLPWSDAARRLQQRIAFLRSLDDAWPDLTTSTLLDTLPDWLGPHLYGRRSLADLRTLDLETVLLSRLTPQQRARLDTLAPTHCQVPSGSRITIDYSEPASPALAVRLQELFGLQDTPRVGGGRVPLTLRLLSPAMRPVQVTRDLASFWRTGYFDVRKDLRGRYPKHYWPDDPLQATPTRRTRPHS
jgi:ATP-dependent helicase HrpB